MKLKAISALSALILTLGAIAGAGDRASAAGAPRIDLINPSNAFQAHADGLPLCNCTDDPGDYSVCHAESVTISFGGANLNISTGQSSSTCASHEVRPGECVYLRYNFLCTKSFWSGLSCSLTSVSTKVKPATDFDCA